MRGVITLQPSSYTDHITDDGIELTKLPYPFHVLSSTGLIMRQDFWRGSPLKVIGFVADPSRSEVDLLWPDAVKDPQRAVGMYVITEDGDGRWATHVVAIRSVVTDDSETPKESTS